MDYAAGWKQSLAICLRGLEKWVDEEEIYGQLWSRFDSGSGVDFCETAVEMMEMEVWKLVMPWLDSQELGLLAVTCREMATAVRCLTECRVGDVTQGQETVAVPVVNHIDDCRYPIFRYTPFCQFFLSSKGFRRNMWGVPGLKTKKLVEADFGGAMTMGSVLLGVGCSCLDLCSSSENGPVDEDEEETILYHVEKKRRKNLGCLCGRLVGGRAAYDQVSRLSVLTKRAKVQSTRASSDHIRKVRCSSPGRTEVKGVAELQNLVDATISLPVQEELEGFSSLSECGPACSCCLSCHNRVSQHGICVGLRVVRTKNKGWSLCASQQIMQGSFVCEYAGELVTNNEARKRHKVYDSLKRSSDWQGSALLVLREHLPSGRALLRVNVDATRIGNVARFINHSCDGGNLLPCIIRLAGCPVPKLGLFAKRSISDGEELTYSYGTGGEVGRAEKPCFCGTTACLGTLPCEST